MVADISRIETAGPQSRESPLPWRRRALTLIELMVAMTASAVIFLAALRAFQQGRFVGAHIDSEMTQAAGTYDLWQLLAGDVGSSFVLEAPEEPGTWVGGTDSMRFLAVRPEGRPVEVEYSFTKAAPGPGSTGQVTRSTRFCSGSAAIGPWERTVVALDVAAFDMRYAASSEGSDALVWTTEFRGDSAPPRAVEVHLVWAAPQDPTQASPQECRWVIATRAQLPAGPAGGGT